MTGLVFAGLLVYGTMVEVAYPTPSLDEQFYECNMNIGKVTQVEQDAGKELLYTVQHECQDYHIVTHKYRSLKLRKLENGNKKD